MVPSYSTQEVINNKTISVSGMFNRNFETNDPLDLKLRPGMRLTVQTRVSDILSPMGKSTNSQRDFFYTVPLASEMLRLVD